MRQFVRLMSTVCLCLASTALSAQPSLESVDSGDFELFGEIDIGPISLETDLATVNNTVEQVLGSELLYAEVYGNIEVYANDSVSVGILKDWGEVVVIRVVSPELRTGRGFGVGTPAIDIKRTYGHDSVTIESDARMLRYYVSEEIIQLSRQQLGGDNLDIETLSFMVDRRGEVSEVVLNWAM